MYDTIGEHSRRMLKQARLLTRPTPARRARRSAGKAAASEGPGGTDRTLCGPFAHRIALGERESPYSASDLRGNPPQC